MRPTAEVPHLWAAYRQLDADGRDNLVARIAVAGAESPELVRLCEVWPAWRTDVFFGQIVLAYSKLDPIHKLAGGRKRGAVSTKTRYVLALVQAHPGETAKDLYKLARAGVDSEASPFDLDAEGELHERLSGKVVTSRAWEKLVSEAKKNLKTKNPKKR